MNPETRTQDPSRANGAGLPLFPKPVARGFDLVVTKLSQVALWLGIICLTLLLGIVLLQVVAGLSSALFPQLSRMMSASWEHAGMLMGAAFVLAMPATLRAGGHIRVTLLRDFLNQGVARFTDIIASLVVTGMLALLAYAMASRAHGSFLHGSVSTASLTPLWLPEAAFAFAFCLFALQALARLLSLLAGIEAESQRDLVGSPTE